VRPPHTYDRSVVYEVRTGENSFKRAVTKRVGRAGGPSVWTAAQPMHRKYLLSPDSVVIYSDFLPRYSALAIASNSPEQIANRLRLVKATRTCGQPNDRTLLYLSHIQLRYRHNPWWASALDLQLPAAPLGSTGKLLPLSLDRREGQLFEMWVIHQRASF